MAQKGQDDAEERGELETLDEFAQDFQRLVEPRLRQAADQDDDCNPEVQICQEGQPARIKHIGHVSVHHEGEILQERDEAALLKDAYIVLLNELSMLLGRAIRRIFND